MRPSIAALASSSRVEAAWDSSPSVLSDVFTACYAASNAKPNWRVVSLSKAAFASRGTIGIAGSGQPSRPKSRDLCLHGIALRTHERVQIGPLNGRMGFNPEQSHLGAAPIAIWASKYFALHDVYLCHVFANKLLRSIFN
jgi:hypothetical protein